jgi:hypothetical protein
MTRADVAKRRSAADKRAAKTTGQPDHTPGAVGVARPGHSARADRIARIAADLAELANDGLLGDDDQDVELAAVWGRTPSRATRELAESENLKKAFLTRHAVLQASVSRGQAAALLGLSEQAVTKHLDQGRIIGIKDRGRWAIPAWQLDADTRDGYLGGIDQLARVFPAGPVALTRWVTGPAADFDGRTPRDLLATGRVDEVVRAAQALTAKGW